MSANFPQSPTLNQVYSFNANTWRWNGRYWQAETVAEWERALQMDLNLTEHAGD